MENQVTAGRQCDNVIPPLPPLPALAAGNDTAETSIDDTIARGVIPTTQPDVFSLNLDKENPQNQILDSATVTIPSTNSHSSISGMTPSTPESNRRSERSRTSPSRLDPSPARNEGGAVLQVLRSGKPSSVPVPPTRRTIALLGVDREQERLLDEGNYDSDGGNGPFFDAVCNEINIDDYEEEARNVEVPVVVNTVEEGRDDEVNEEEVVAAEIADEREVGDETPPALTIEMARGLKVAEINAELKKRRIGKQGKTRKNDLLGLLEEAIRNNVPIFDAASGGGDGDAGNIIQAPGIEDGFEPQARWVELKRKDEAVDCPTQEGFRGPTQPASQTIENVRYDFQECFDRPVFKECSPEWRFTKSKKNRRVQMDGRGVPRYFSSLREKGRAKVSWLEKHGLNNESQPWEYVEGLMRTDLTGENKERTLFNDWTAWTNTKAVLGNVGRGGVYNGFTDFDVEEIKRFVGLYVLNGLNISPRIEYKFESQENDWVNGNDAVNRAFGKIGVTRHKQFKYLFACQDPLVLIPDRKTAPNHKVDHFFSHMLEVFSDSYDVGKDISGVEQDSPFQGKHQDKQRVNYKKAGDGFMIDSICEDGFTISFYPRNSPAPTKWLQKGFSPTHSRILHMLDTLDGQYYRCGMDNLFISAKFLRGAFADCSSKVMIHGVCRKTGRGIPSCILQADEKDPTSVRAQQLRGTTKAAVLVGDSGCKDLCAFSVYDVKPVYFMSMAAENLNWKVKERKVYDVTKKKEVKMKFLRTEIQDNYNNNMNSVDIADQLRGSYSFQRFTRNRKWWWSYWMWGMGVIIVNAYRLYVTAHRHIYKTQKKQIMDQYSFRKNVCEHWVCPWMRLKSPLTQSSTTTTTTRKRKSQYDGNYEEEDESTTFSSRTRSENKKHAHKLTKATRISDNTLHPTTGDLKCRLDTSLSHLPSPDISEGKLKCALHCYLNRGYEVKKKVMKCSTCQVALCIHCYTIFHTVKCTENIKKAVQHVVEELDQCKTARNK